MPCKLQPCHMYLLKTDRKKLDWDHISEFGRIFHEQILVKMFLAIPVDHSVKL